MGKRTLTTAQRQKIPFDMGLLFKNYGVASQVQLAPLSGPSKVEITKNIYDIPYSGKMGKSMGTQVVTSYEAKITTNIMDTAMATIGELVAPWAYYASNKLEIKSDQIGAVIADAKYIANLTVFIKKLDGNYMKVSLYNAMNEGNFTIEAKDGVEGMIPLEIFAHWESEDDTAILADIEELAAIADPPA